MRDCLEENFPDAFEFSERRDQFDYIYSVDKLQPRARSSTASATISNRFLRPTTGGLNPSPGQSALRLGEMNQQWKQIIAQEGRTTRAWIKRGRR